MQCSRGSNKNFWRHCRGGSRKQVNKTKYPSQSLSLALHYLPFASRFPLPHFTLAILFAPLPFDLLFACAFYVLASLLGKNLSVWIHLKCSTWIIFDPYALVLKPQLA